MDKICDLVYHGHSHTEFEYFPSKEKAMLVADIDGWKEEEFVYSTHEICSVIDLFHTIIDKPCVVLEKPGYWVDSMYKCGFHLAFPEVYLTLDEYSTVILHVWKLWSLLSLIPHAQLDMLVSKRPTRWLLYGGYRHGVYKVTRCFDPCGERDVKEYMRSIDIGIPYTRPIEYYYPMILSIFPRSLHLSS